MCPSALGRGLRPAPAPRDRTTAKRANVMARITFIQNDGTERVVEAEPGMTVMEAAVKNNIPGIAAECGGACACATCHVWVGEDWLAKLAPPSAEELEMLDGAFNVDERSRLCCQIRKAVLPGSHSQRNTRFDRNDNRLKSSAGRVKVCAPSLTM